MPYEVLLVDHDNPVLIHRAYVTEIGKHGIPGVTFTRREDDSYDIEVAIQAAEVPPWLS